MSLEDWLSDDLQLDCVGLAADLYSGLHRVGILDAQGFLLAAGAVVAGSGLVYADFDDFIARGGSSFIGSGSFSARGCRCLHWM